MSPLYVMPSPLAPSSASAPRFNRSLRRRAFIIVLPLRDLILVGIQNPQFAGAQPIPQLGMKGQYRGQLDDCAKRLLFIKVVRDRFAHVLPGLFRSTVACRCS
jgi:hypothetical protein